MGVLQRINLVYLLTVIVILNLSRKQLYGLATTLLIGVLDGHLTNTWSWLWS